VSSDASQSEGQEYLAPISLGKHILVDLYECNHALLDDADFIAAAMKMAAEAGGATIIDSTFHRFSPYGVTGVIAIKESHLAIHTWPEYGYAAVDLFTCGDSVDSWKAYESLKSALEAARGSTVEVLRGRRDLLGGDQNDNGLISRPS